MCSNFRPAACAILFFHRGKRHELRGEPLGTDCQARATEHGPEPYAAEWWDVSKVCLRKPCDWVLRMRWNLVQLYVINLLSCHGTLELCHYIANMKKQHFILSHKFSNACTGLMNTYQKKYNTGQKHREFSSHQAHICHWTLTNSQTAAHHLSASLARAPTAAHDTWDSADGASEPDCHVPTPCIHFGGL